MKLNIAAFAIAFGIWCGGGLFVMTWLLILIGADPRTMTILQTIFLGYAISPLGSLVGFAWGFFFCAICGAVLAWLYNLFAKRFGASAS